MHINLMNDLRGRLFRLLSLYLSYPGIFPIMELLEIMAIGKDSGFKTGRHIGIHQIAWETIPP